MEAEDIIQSGFEAEDHDIASGDAVVSLLNTGETQGELSYDFAGGQATYDLTISAHDESDGVSTIEVLVNGFVVESIDLEGATSSGVVSEDNRVLLRVEGLDLGPGDVVSVLGRQGGDEWVRIDKLDFTLSNDAPPPSDDEFSIEAEDMLAVGYIDEFRSAASNGELATLLGGDDIGSLQYEFDGDDGVYELVVTAFDESDGVGQFEVRINGQLLMNHVLNQHFGENIVSDQNRIQVKLTDIELRDGDVVEIVGYRDLEEYARIDRLDFTRTGDLTGDPPQNRAPVIADLSGFDLSLDEDQTIFPTLEQIAFALDTLVTDPDGDDVAVTVVLNYPHSTGLPSETLEIRLNETPAWTPPRDFNGEIEAIIYADDGQGAPNSVTTRTETIVVRPVNDDPVADDQTIMVAEDSSYDGVLTAMDVDGDMLTFSAVQDSGPTNGNVDILPDGTFTYTPDPDFNGNDSFRFLISDGNGGSNEGVVDIVVDDVAEVPDVTIGDASILEGDAGVFAVLMIPIMKSHASPGGSTIEVAVSNQTATEGVDYELLTPTVSFGDADTLQYAEIRIIGDNDVETDETFLISITQALNAAGALNIVDGEAVATIENDDAAPMNQAPVTTPIALDAITEDDGMQNIDLLAGQFDPDGDALSTEDVSAIDDLGDDVALYINNDGTVDIDPAQYSELNDGESRMVTIRYDVSDGVLTTQNTATIEIMGVTDNTGPDAIDDVVGNGDAVSEFLVNSETAGDQRLPSIAMLAGGNFVITWHSTDSQQDTSGNGVKAKIFTSDGDPVGEEFLVNSVTNNDQITPSIAALPNGGFVITWKSDDGQQDTSGSGIKARIFTSDGTPAGDEFLVNTDTFSEQYNPSITVQETGGFMIVWHNDDGDEHEFGATIKAQVFQDDGTPVGDEIVVESTIANTGYASDVAAMTNGGYVVTWWGPLEQNVFEWGRSDFGSEILARLYASDGTPIGDEFFVSTDSAEVVFVSDEAPSAAVLENGSFVIAWQSHDTDLDPSDYGIKARIFTADGSASGEFFRVNTETTGPQFNPNVEALAGGGFVVTWMSLDGQQDAAGWGIKGQIYSSDGAPVGNEFLVNDETINDQTSSQTMALEDGGFVITWESDDGRQDVSGDGIKAMIFDADGNRIQILPPPINEDTVLTIDFAELLANDTDADGDDLTIIAIDGTSTNGASVTPNGDGTISYDPTNAAAIQALNDGDALEDTFTYTISDGNGGTDTAAVTVNIAGVTDNGPSDLSFVEDWESLSDDLGPFVTETGGDGTDWTAMPPEGWTVENPTPEGGVPEFFGWTFLDFNSWLDADDQRRSEFSNASGIVAVADPDEYYDTGNVGPGTFTSSLVSPDIDITGVSGSINIAFDSSWRPEDDQEATVLVSFDGGARMEVLRFLSDPNDPDFKSDSVDERINLQVELPNGATTMQIIFHIDNATNDWWWAVDNIEVKQNIAAPDSVGSTLAMNSGDFLEAGSANEPADLPDSAFALSGLVLDDDFLLPESYGAAASVMPVSTSDRSALATFDGQRPVDDFQTVEPEAFPENSLHELPSFTNPDDFLI